MVWATLSYVCLKKLRWNKKELTYDVAIQHNINTTIWQMIWYFKSDQRGYLIKGNMAITQWLLCCPSEITSLCALSQPLQKPQLQTSCWLPCCLPKPLQSRLFLINTCLADPHTFPRPQDSVLWHEKGVDGWCLQVFLKMRIYGAKIIMNSWRCVIVPHNFKALTTA